MSGKTKKDRYGGKKKGGGGGKGTLRFCLLLISLMPAVGD